MVLCNNPPYQDINFRRQYDFLLAEKLQIAYRTFLGAKYEACFWGYSIHPSLSFVHYNFIPLEVEGLELLQLATQIKYGRE